MTIYTYLARPSTYFEVLEYDWPPVSSSVRYHDSLDGLLEIDFSIDYAPENMWPREIPNIYEGLGMLENQIN